MININSVAYCNPYSVFIHIAGKIDIIEKVCSEYCSKVGLCVTVTTTNYIYKNGQELGARIGLINYPRFPDKCENGHYSITDKAIELAKLIATECDQISYTIETPDKMYYYYDSKLKPMPY